MGETRDVMFRFSIVMLLLPGRQAGKSLRDPYFISITSVLFSSRGGHTSKLAR